MSEMYILSIDHVYRKLFNITYDLLLTEVNKNHSPRFLGKSTSLL